MRSGNCSSTSITLASIEIPIFGSWCVPPWIFIATTANKPSICILPRYLYRRIPNVSSLHENGCSAWLRTRIEGAYWAFRELLIWDFTLQNLFVPTFGPLTIVITTFLKMKVWILVVDPDMVSVVVPAYNRNLRSFSSFSKTSPFGPGVGKRVFAQFLYDSQIICIIRVARIRRGIQIKLALVVDTSFFLEPNGHNDSVGWEDNLQLG